MPTTLRKTKPVRVLIVDDHPVVLEGITRLLEHEGDLKVAGVAEDAGEALRLLNAAEPDLVLLDVSLPGINGIELLKEIRARDGRVRVLMLSVHDETLYAERALRAGALGYLRKDAGGPRIVAAIRQVLQGKIYLSDQMTDRILHRMTAGDSPSPASAMDRLSDRELEVFELLGRGKTTRQIAKLLFVSTKTVETYRGHIKAKLGLRTAVELIQHAAQWVMAH